MQVRSGLVGVSHEQSRFFVDSFIFSFPRNIPQTGRGSELGRNKARPWPPEKVARCVPGALFRIERMSDLQRRLFFSLGKTWPPAEMPPACRLSGSSALLRHVTLGQSRVLALLTTMIRPHKAYVLQEGPAPGASAFPPAPAPSDYFRRAIMYCMHPLRGWFLPGRKGGSPPIDLLIGCPFRVLILSQARWNGERTTCIHQVSWPVAQRREELGFAGSSMT